MFLPKLIESTQPLIKENSTDTMVELPFEGFTKHAYPEVQ